jgi:hypothetical protein
MAQTGISILVSLLRHDEQIKLGLELEADACSRHTIQFVSLPVPDRAPSDNSGAAAARDTRHHTHDAGS